MKRFDCHCHIFNITNVGWKAILGPLTEVKEEINSENVKIKSTSSTKKASNLKIKLKRIAELIKIFTQNSEKIFNELDKHYNKEYILAPLMFDGDYLITGSSEADAKEQLKSLLDDIKKYVKELIKKPKAKSSSINDITTSELEDILKFLEDLEDTEPVMLKKSGSKTKEDGFIKQYNSIKAIYAKNNGRIMPFLGVDPRRKDIKSYLKEVGPGKLFAGVKVYPPNGFSPMDKELVGKDSVFEFCHKNGIPVISHCSYGGFATPVTTIDINGYIIPKGKIQPEKFNGTYIFEKGVNDGFDIMVKERAEVLNHPRIWRKVMEIYPNLKLVLAHFGSGNEEWQNEILSMMKEYKNLYTDVSCMSDENILKSVKRIYNENPGIRHKILYGSDYFLDMFFNDSFDSYLKRIENIFGKEMYDIVSSENPQMFFTNEVLS